ncbi:type IX secretion system membrane protein PorP/SprF [Psychroserpens sp.]|uniref:PorP/SprF family type IX secretion system membrane protein n=1 Tax=Psychroserpens sp. TaxID=2020870 RepID=UPI001B033642|nr:type IX secretion system membrane protein PorP/SprF [Psychroserpens sp.]MBO6607261.1 type IX secretion system membrane protein PorP/SprF [Psychroserpens sp.]MBO6654663.1 type IX secretion system membrane protein PorP/SprF [Psychroserpens sp.]MBO6680990.1 type IX secretion system membrane protein PorP/SprF [Psychroserpens sp.]MBO6750055.1 type IX secretion system membrane protein PorP/SprF [Psychroserpens sp.]MBO6915959.1 type IX secretion system membrane protein PorP/SprF [Psychroserpens sp
MKLIKFNIIAFILFSSWMGVAQQLPQFTQYMYNTISINPAYAGSRETLSIVGLHRSQWVGLEGGPQTQTLSIHAPMRNEKVGLGLSFINDELGFQNFSYLYGDFSYTIRTGEKSELAFGLKAGFTSYSLDADFQQSQSNDPVIFGFENRWKPNIGTGVYWHSNKWYLGLSAPRILNTDYTGDAEFEALERISYYFTGGYVFKLSENTMFKPAVLLKATNGAPLSFDATANFLFHDKFWIGAGYRVNERAGAIGGIADFQVSKQLRIGYAYEYPISDLRPYTSGTHEVLLMFEVFKSKRIKSPRYF